MWVRGMIVICTVSEENVPVENASSEWNNALLQLQSGLVVIESKDLALRNLQREALGAWFYIIILWIGAVVPKFLRYSISKFQLNLDTSYEETFSRPGRHNWDYFRTVLMNTKHKYFGQNIYGCEPTNFMKIHWKQFNSKYHFEDNFENFGCCQSPNSYLKL